MRRLVIILVCMSVMAGCGPSGPDSAPTTTAPASATTSTQPPPPTTLSPSTSMSQLPPTTATSATTTLATVAPDTTAPALTVSDPARGATVTTRTYRFRGSTEPGCSVIAAGRYQADVDADGGWSVLLVLNPGSNVATFTASDATGNVTEVSVSVDYAPRLTIGDAVAIAQAQLDALWSADPSNQVGAIEIRCDDPEIHISAGGVFTCAGIGRITATLEVGNLAFLVLDERGATSMLSGSDLPDLQAAYADTAHGLLCRDLLTDKVTWPFNAAGTTDNIAAFLATAYWFLEGQPDRMDADRNGIPCETVFPAEAIAWVWDGGLLTGEPS